MNRWSIVKEKKKKKKKRKGKERKGKGIENFRQEKGVKGNRKVEYAVLYPPRARNGVDIGARVACRVGWGGDRKVAGGAEGKQLERERGGGVS